MSKSYAMMSPAELAEAITPAWNGPPVKQIDCLLASAVATKLRELSGRVDELLNSSVNIANSNDDYIKEVDRLRNSIHELEADNIKLRKKRRRDKRRLQEFTISACADFEAIEKAILNTINVACRPPDGIDFDAPAPEHVPKFGRVAVLSHDTRDAHDEIAPVHTIGLTAQHTGNSKLYVVVGVTWLGATDEWGIVMKPHCSDVTITRPVSHMHGRRDNGMTRYKWLSLKD